jgi:hypothetical protein
MPYKNPEDAKAHRKSYNEAHRVENNARTRRYYEANKEQIKARNTGRKDEKRAYDKAHYKPYYEANKIERRAAVKAWREANKEKRNAYERNRRRTDSQFRIAANLRRRLRDALNGHTKNGSAIKDLGCSVSELKKHLEKLFQPGMMWENYGEWEIDHIKPIASFDLTDRKQLLEVCHYTNLQPLWSKDNKEKGNR